MANRGYMATASCLVQPPSKSAWLWHDHDRNLLICQAGLLKDGGCLTDIFWLPPCAADDLPIKEGYFNTGGTCVNRDNVCHQRRPTRFLSISLGMHRWSRPVN